MLAVDGAVGVLCKKNSCWTSIPKEAYGVDSTAAFPSMCPDWASSARRFAVFVQVIDGLLTRIGGAP